MTPKRPSFSLLAYGCNQNCRLTGIAEHRAKLISIGAHGARVRLCDEAGSALRFGEHCLLEVDCALENAPVGEIPCVVAWMNGCEAGVDFHTRFDASILALQLVMNQGLLAREEAA